MSGGSMNYFYSTLEEYSNVLGDRELNDLVKDLVKVFHDKEWWDSADIGEGSYNLTVKNFKEKWFTVVGQNRRYAEYIDTAIRDLKRELRLDTTYCKDCKHYMMESRYDGKYGRCKHYTTCMVHAYDTPCEEYEER